MPTEIRDVAEVRNGDFDVVFLDVVGACNLRCVYCYQSDKDFRPHSGIGDEILEKAIDFARIYSKSINLTSQGEFTFGKNWITLAERVLSSGIAITGTSNFARLLSSEEIGVLSRFEMICVSLDTVDRDILKSIRRAADIRTITHNIARVRGMAIAAGRRPPAIIVNCVLSTSNALKIKELVGYCSAIGVQSVSVSPLHDYGAFGFDKAQLSDERVDDPVATWDQDRLRLLRKELVNATKVAKMCGIQFGVSESLMQRLEARLAGDAAPAAAPERAEDALPAGLTRICLQPWNRVVVEPNGDVVPCCYGAEKVGNIAQGFEAVVNGEKIRRLKESLLKGSDLQAACRKCIGEPAGTPAELSAKVQTYLASR